MNTATIQFMQRIDAIKLRLGISKAAACKMCGFSEATLSYIRNGQQPITAKHYKMLAAAEVKAGSGEADNDFVRRTDVLAARLGVRIEDLPDIIGMSRANLFRYRKGKPASKRVLEKLAMAEGKVEKAGTGQPLNALITVRLIEVLMGLGAAGGKLGEAAETAATHLAYIQEELERRGGGEYAHLASGLAEDARGIGGDGNQIKAFWDSFHKDIEALNKKHLFKHEQK